MSVGVAAVAGVGRRGWAAETRALRIVGTTPDLAGIAREVAGVRGTVVSLAKGPEDPHTLELKPSHSTEVDRSDLFLQVGLGIENAWLKDLMATVRYPAVRPGGAGHLNLGKGVRLLDGVQAEGVPGSFHEEGNPHYLLDPIEGLRVARAVAGRLAALRPEWKANFEKAERDFRRRIGTWLVGEECGKEDDFEALVLRIEGAQGAAREGLLKEHRVGGFLGALQPHRGRFIVGDHDLWPYLARRCGLEILGYLEPSPGAPPTTRHLQQLIGQMRERKADLVLSSPYFEPRHGEFVARATGAKVVPMAHQTAARPGTDTYPAMLAYNGRQLIEALGRKA